MFAVHAFYSLRKISSTVAPEGMVCQRACTCRVGTPQPRLLLIGGLHMIYCDNRDRDMYSHVWISNMWIAKSLRTLVNVLAFSEYAFYAFYAR